jgi:hypothetical protein
MLFRGSLEPRSQHEERVGLGAHGVGEAEFIVEQWGLKSTI